MIWPWVGRNISTLTCISCPPDLVFKASLSQLKRLTLVYQLEYPESRYHNQWHPALLYVANAMLGSVADSEWIFYFSICLQGYRNLATPYRFAALCVRGLLTMAVHHSKLAASKARDMIQKMARDCETLTTADQYTSGIRLSLSDIDPALGGTRLDQISRKLEEITTPVIPG